MIGLIINNGSTLRSNMVPAASSPKPTALDIDNPKIMKGNNDYVTI